MAVPGGLGLVGVLVFVAFQLLSGGSGYAVPGAFDDGAQAPDGGAIPAGQDPERDLRDFSEYVFDSAQRSWARTFDGGYQDAKLYLYRGGVNTGCGSASSAVGPFYCPADQRVYLDLSFFGDMEDQLGAPGDFAWAYVIAHEVGHHVQNLRGTERRGAPPAARGSRIRPTRCRCGSSCRPTATPASGRAPCSTSSTTATSRRRSAPRRRSATTGLQRRRDGRGPQRPTPAVDGASTGSSPSSARSWLSGTRAQSAGSRGPSDCWPSLA